MLLMVKLAVPLFLSVTTLAALVVPIPNVEKAKLVGDKVAFGPEITAVLVKAIVCGLPRNRRKPSPCRSCSRTFSARTPFGLWKLPPCAGDNDPGRSVAEILSKTQSLSGGVVRVRGALGVGPLYDAPSVADLEMQNKSAHKCDPATECCKWTWSPVLVGGPDGALSIEHRSCFGDESRACCNAPAYGQNVIASGVLVPEQRYIRTVGWRLVNVTLCEEGGSR